jgi:cytochrome c oxidase assembly factor CtaG
VLFAVVLWVKRAPILFEAALNHATLHALEHLAFLLSAVENTLHS